MSLVYHSYRGARSVVWRCPTVVFFDNKYPPGCGGGGGEGTEGQEAVYHGIPISEREIRLQPAFWESQLLRTSPCRPRPYNYISGIINGRTKM